MNRSIVMRIFLYALLHHQVKGCNGKCNFLIKNMALHFELRVS